MAGSASKRTPRSRGSAAKPAAPRKPAKAATAAAAAAAPGAGQSIWLAGLGALARAQAEGARHFRTLVQAGVDFDDQLRKAAKARSQAAGEFVEAVGERMRSTLPVVSRQEFEALRTRVETLARSVERLQRADAAAASAAPSSTAARSGNAARRPVAHSVRRVRDELADVAKELEKAQIAARDTPTRGTSRKR